MGEAYIIMLILKTMIQIYIVQHNNDRLCLWSTYYVPGSFMYSICITCSTLLQDRYYYYFHFTDEKLKHRVGKTSAHDHTTAMGLRAKNDTFCLHILLDLSGQKSDYKVNQPLGTSHTMLPSLVRTKLKPTVWKLALKLTKRSVLQNLRCIFKKIQT